MTDFPRLIVRDVATGRVKHDGSTNVGLLFGRLSLGGAGTPRAGSITDERFVWPGMRPFVHVLGAAPPAGDNYELDWSISGTTLSWSYPAPGDRLFERPLTSLLYGAT